MSATAVGPSREAESWYMRAPITPRQVRYGVCCVVTAVAQTVFSRCLSSLLRRIGLSGPAMPWWRRIVCHIVTNGVSTYMCALPLMILFHRVWSGCEPEAARRQKVISSCTLFAGLASLLFSEQRPELMQVFGVLSLLSLSVLSGDMHRGWAVVNGKSCLIDGVAWNQDDWASSSTTDRQTYVRAYVRRALRTILLPVDAPFTRKMNGDMEFADEIVKLCPFAVPCLPELTATHLDIRFRRTFRQNYASEIERMGDPYTCFQDMLIEGKLSQEAWDRLPSWAQTNCALGLMLPLTGSGDVTEDEKRAATQEAFLAALRENRQFADDVASCYPFVWGRLSFNTALSAMPSEPEYILQGCADTFITWCYDLKKRYDRFTTRSPDPSSVAPPG